ncbi:MAG: hypothetical protein A2081_00760 [Elusimicrobia bacterium GWC2_61_19]|nr:MAG: hypothetical protein A2081_00760 [Elusimicrobia bacterium GWC2_61_19]
MDEKNPFGGIRTYDNYSHLWQLTGFILLLQVAVSVLVFILGDSLGVKFSPFESIIPALLVTGYTSWAMLDGLGVSWRAALAEWNSQLPSDLKKALKYLAGYGLMLLIIVAILMAAYWFWGAGLEKVMKPLEDRHAGESARLAAAAVSRLRVLLVLFSACVVAPVVEEVFFRRIVFTTLRLKNGFWTSAFWAGLLFAVFHGAAAPLILPAGVYLCWVYERERRLTINIMLHAMVNLIMVTLKLFL